MSAKVSSSGRTSDSQLQIAPRGRDTILGSTTYLSIPLVCLPFSPNSWLNPNKMRHMKGEWNICWPGSFFSCLTRGALGLAGVVAGVLEEELREFSPVPPSDPSTPISSSNSSFITRSASPWEDNTHTHTHTQWYIISTAWKHTETRANNGALFCDGVIQLN